MKRTAPPFPRLLTIAEVAEILRVHPRTVQRRIRDGELHFHDLSGSVRVTDDDLAAYIATGRR